LLDQITPLILTYNEAPNIGCTLEQLRWARDIVVVDSFSNDQTLEIISRFPQARVFQRKFDNFASQCNFGLTQTGIATEWVLNLDADYILTQELAQELRDLKPKPEVIGCRARFVYCIEGRRLRSGIYPPVVVLFRKSMGEFRQDGHAHRLHIDGNIEDLLSPILHDDRKPLSRWFEAQTRYTKLEADKLLNSDPATLSWTDRIRRWRVVAPLAVLFYCLIVRGGIFDGWPGFYYAFQRMLAEAMLSLYLIDHDLRKNFGFRIADFEFRETRNQPRINADNTDQKEEDRRQQEEDRRQQEEGRRQQEEGRRQQASGVTL
jgi:glycosyltransferase involved in cell wall biosynthesis